jgi:hypothetical protein
MDGQKNGSSGRIRTLRSIRKSNAISNLVETIARSILRFRRIRLLRRKLVQELVQTGIKGHEDFRASRIRNLAADDRYHGTGVGQD